MMDEVCAFRPLRRGAAVAVTFALAATVGSLAGCDSGGSDAAAGSSQQPVDASQEAAEAPASDYAVSIDGCTVTTDYQGAPAVIIDYTFTNNSDEDTSFAVACSQKAFQNGVQLESAIVTDDLGNGYMAEIKPGATTQARLAYTLTDQSDVTVEVEELISFDDAKLAEATFSVA